MIPFASVIGIGIWKTILKNYLLLIWIQRCCLGSLHNQPLKAGIYSECIFVVLMKRCNAI